MGPHCSGPCDECYASYASICIAGNNDDDFMQIDLESAKELYDILVEEDDKKLIPRLLGKFPGLKLIN